MNFDPRIKRLARAAALSTAAGLLAAPTMANVNIPEGGAVPRDSLYIVHLRVLEGCDGAATDRLEVHIPESVRNVTPEAIPGWTVEVEIAGGEGEPMAPAEVPDGEEASIVRWSGGPLPAGEFMDFGMRAYFPVTQTCGLTAVEWDGDKGTDNAAPRVTIGSHVGQRELGEIEDVVRTLSDDVASLGEELKGVNPSRIQSRLAEAESQIDQRFPRIVERLDRLADRIQTLEDSSQTSE